MMGCGAGGKYLPYKVLIFYYLIIVIINWLIVPY